MMVAALIYAIGDVSGAHFNPGVTTAFAMKRLFPPRLVPAYWVAQLLGAITGAVVVRILLGSAVEAAVSTPHVSSFLGRGVRDRADPPPRHRHPRHGSPGSDRGRRCSARTWEPPSPCAVSSRCHSRALRITPDPLAWPSAC